MAGRLVRGLVTLERLVRRGHLAAELSTVDPQAPEHGTETVAAATDVPLAYARLSEPHNTCAYVG